MEAKFIYLCTAEDSESGVAFERKEDAIDYCKKNEDFSWTNIWYNYHLDLEF